MIQMVQMMSHKYCSNFLRYQELQHIWNYRNYVMFDGRYEVKAYIKKLNDILM